MTNDIFLKIINKEIPSTILYEDSEIIIIKDIAPKAPVHILCITKKKYRDVSGIVSEQKESLLFHCFKKMIDTAKSLGVEDSFRILTNKGENAGQEIMHLHFHLQGFFKTTK